MWKPRTSGEKPKLICPAPEENLARKEPGQAEADSQTKKWYDKEKINPGQGQEPWQAKDTGAVGKLNDV